MKTKFLLVLVLFASVGYGEGLEKQQEEIRAYELKCQDNQPEACFSLYWLYDEGRGVIKDRKYAKTLLHKAYGLFDQKCQDGEASACEELALIENVGIGHKRNVQKAHKYLLRACELGGMKSCYELGILYEYGIEIPKDFKKAREFYDKSCKAGIEQGCQNLKELKK